MASFTPSEFLEVLQANIEERGAALSRGEVALTLNPRCLAFLSSLFGQYEESGSFPAEFSHSDLVQLYSFFLRLPSMVIQPTIPGKEEPLSGLDVFVGLTSLQVHDVVTPLFQVPSSLRARLQQLSVRGMLHSASSVMAVSPEDSNTPGGLACWPQLRRLDLSHNFLRDVSGTDGVNGLDLVTLNLSHNLLSSMPRLDCCLQLERLNVSFNRIPDVTKIKECVGGIKSLSLQGNSLVSSAGVEFLMALEVLDLRDNSITSWGDVQVLRRLPFLSDLWLSGNPICQRFSYRLDVFRIVTIQNEVRESNILFLDGSGPSRAESEALKTMQGQIPVPIASPPVRTLMSPPASESPIASSPASFVPVSKKKKKSAKVVLESQPFKPKSEEQKEAKLEPPPEITVVQEADEFAEKVKKLHEEGGSKWLVILDGLERDESDSPQKKKQHHRSKSGSSSHHRSKSGSDSVGSQVAKVPVSEPLQPAVPEVQASVEPEVPPPPEKLKTVLSIELSMEILWPDQVFVTSPPQRPPSPPPVTAVPVVADPPAPKESRFTLAPSKKKKSNVKMASRASRIQVESEFLVLRQNQATGEYDQQRVLMIGASRITEADVERGDTVVTLDTTDLVHVEEIVFGSGEEMGPVVRAEFMSRGGLQETKSVYAWRTLDAIDGAKFLARLKAIEEANRVGQNNLCKCVNCGHVFAAVDEAPCCPVCQSTMAARFSKATDVQHQQQLQPPPSLSPHKKNLSSSSIPTVSEDSGSSSLVSSTSSTTALSSSGGIERVSKRGSVSMQLPEFLSQRDLDHGLEVFLKIKILVDANSEKFCCLIKTDVAVFTERSPVDVEKPLWLMISSERLYILSLSEQESSGYGFSVVSTFLLSSFVRITVGLFMSWLRFDGTPQCVLCCTSAHVKTHKLLDVAREALPKALVMHVGAVSASIIKRSVLSGDDLIMYARVRMRRKSRRATMLFSGGGSSEWRTLILSSDVIVLCDEDAGRWFVQTGGSPNFSEQQHRSLVDVVALVHDEGDCSVTIEFDSDAKHVMGWQMEFASPQEKLRNLHILSNAWSKQMGGIDLLNKR